MKPKFKICFSHNHVWFYQGNTIVCNYREGANIWFDHRSGECELKWFKKL